MTKAIVFGGLEPEHSKQQEQALSKTFVRQAVGSVLFVESCLGPHCHAGRIRLEHYTAFTPHLHHNYPRKHSHRAALENFNSTLDQHQELVS